VSLALERPADAHDDATTVSYIAGAGTPVGVSGVELARTRGSTFEMTGGIGIGLAAANAHGKPNPLQWAAMPRLRFGGDRGAFTVGVGVSGGNYGRAPNCNVLGVFACSYGVEYTVWVNVEAGGEVGSPAGVAFRYFAGYGHGFASGASFNIPYAGVGLGYRF
jgi:hypothetical protein